MIPHILFAAARRRDTEEPETPPSAPAAPSNLSVYEYSSGTRFGIQWTLGDSSATHEMFRADVLYAPLAPGISSQDVGVKASNGTHTWKCRAFKSGLYSAFSSAITTSNGQLA
jgi:hypothetical protein